jgi:hypothetical protein
MERKYVYLLIGLLGLVLPYSQLIPWIVEHGLDVSLFIEQLVTSRVAAFGWLDAGVSGLALFAFILIEGREGHVPHRWLPVAGTLLVGVSFGLPLYLYLRETARETQEESR